jgi:hypothetical protein
MVAGDGIDYSNSRSRECDPTHQRDAKYAASRAVRGCVSEAGFGSTEATARAARPSWRSPARGLIYSLIDSSGMPRGTELRTDGDMLA